MDPVCASLPRRVVLLVMALLVTYTLLLPCNRHCSGLPATAQQPDITVPLHCQRGLLGPGPGGTTATSLDQQQMQHGAGSTCRSLELQGQQLMQPQCLPPPDSLSTCWSQLTTLTLYNIHKRITPEWVDMLLPHLPASLHELQLIHKRTGEPEPLLYTFTLPQLTNLTSLELDMEGEPDSWQVAASSRLPQSIQALLITAPLPGGDRTFGQLVLQLTALRNLQLYLDYMLPASSLLDMGKQLTVLTHVELGVKRFLPDDDEPAVLAGLRRLPLRCLHVMREGEWLLGGVGQLTHLTQLAFERLKALCFRQAAASLQQLTSLQHLSLGAAHLPDGSVLPEWHFGLLSYSAETEVVVSFVEAMAGLPKLRHLSLSRIPIGSAVMHFAHATQLTELRVAHYAYDGTITRAEVEEHKQALRSSLPEGCSICVYTKCID